MNMIQRRIQKARITMRTAALTISMVVVAAAHAAWDSEPIPIRPGDQHWETLEFVGDADVYTFEITQPNGAGIELWTIGYDLYANTAMHLVRDTQDPRYDQTVTFDAYDEHSGYNQYSYLAFECGRNPLPQGKYFLYVWDLGRYDNQPIAAKYSVNMLFTRSCIGEDSREKYNSHSNTVRRMLSDSVEETYTLHDVADEDYFVFVAPANSKVVFTLIGDDSARFDISEHRHTAPHVGPVFRTGSWAAQFESPNHEQQYYVTIRRDPDAQFPQFYPGQIQEEYSVKVRFEPLN